MSLLSAHPCTVGHVCTRAHVCPGHAQDMCVHGSCQIQDTAAGLTEALKHWAQHFIGIRLNKLI